MPYSSLLSDLRMYQNTLSFLPHLTPRGSRAENTRKAGWWLVQDSTNASSQSTKQIFEPTKI